MKSISDSITFKNLTNRQDFTPQRFLFVVFLLWQIVSFLGILISKGELWTNIIWSGDSAALFPDFVETVFQSYGLKPYKTGAIYPPIVYVLFSLFTYLLPPSVFLNKKGNFRYANWSPNSFLPEVHAVSTCFFVAASILLFFIIKRCTKDDKGNYDKRLLWIVFTSAPFFFTVERGNILLLLIVPFIYFCVNYDSLNTKTRLLAYFCLSLVVSFKVYPVLLGALILLDKKDKNRFKNALICIGIGIATFFVPFIFTGGIDSMFQFIENITAHSSRSTNTFGLGEKIDVVNSMKIVGFLFNLSPVGKFASLQKLAPFAVVIMGGLGAVFNTKKWKRAACLILATILFPSFSVRYNVLYLIVPLILFYKEEANKSAINYIYAALFALCFAPFAFGADSLYPIVEALCKLHLGTMVPALSLIAFLVVLLIDGIISFKNNFKKPILKEVSA